MFKTQYEKILNYNRDPILTPWFQKKLHELISFGVYHDQTNLLVDQVVAELSDYGAKYHMPTVVLGVSGGVDSAVTAALFKRAGYRVVGVTMPIYQDPAETQRGIEAVNKLELEHHHVDLSTAYDQLLKFYQDNTGDFGQADVSSSTKIRKGNIRARLRMVTLYNLASKYRGFVASTDNFSELSAGFWTLHGDVGDVSPIQSFTKSWEVPEAASILEVPSSIISALPTDGLGITAGGDEAQLGVSYLEFDVALFVLISSAKSGKPLTDLTEQDKVIIDTVRQRIKQSRFKRANPYFIEHPYHSNRFDDLKLLDTSLV